MYYEFQSTPSARRATLAAGAGQGQLDISIHALREEGDEFEQGRAGLHQDFNPRPPRGGRLCFRDALSEKSDISIHALRVVGDPYRSCSFMRLK